MASTAVNANPTSVKALGSLPTLTPANANRVTIDTYTKQPSRPTAAPATPAAAPAAPAKPESELAKVGGDLYAGALGAGAGGLGVVMGKGMLSLVDQAGALTFKNVAMQSLGMGGVLMGIPMQTVQDSFAYKSGKISAQRYWGNVAGHSLGWGAWMGGAMTVATLLGGVGFWPAAAGLAAGMVLNDISDHTVGRWVSNFVASHIPAGLAKTGANAVVKYITNPIDKYIVSPIKHHLGIFLATGGAAAVALGLKTGMGKDALKGAGAMAASSLPQIAGGIVPALNYDNFLNKAFPMTGIKGVDLTPGKGQMISPADGTLVKKS